MKNLTLAKNKILKAKTIVIAGHINPDGDSIGSLLSLGCGLKKLHKRVYMISCDGVPKRYRFLPGADRVLKKITIKPDLGIAVDCGSNEILGDNFKSLEKAKEILVIDHHEFRRPFGDVRLVDPNAASVGEIVYKLLRHMGVNVTKDIAENILTSIIVETNSFKLPNVRPETFSICSKLVDKGMDYYKLVDNVYWSKNRASVLLTGICLSRCKFLLNNKIAWSVVRHKDFDRAGGKDEDVDAVADEIRSIKGVKIVVLFRENSGNKLRVSLRSKDKINVASVAEAFGGGGHYDIAGCSIPNNSKSIRKLLKLTQELFKE